MPAGIVCYGTSNTVASTYRHKLPTHYSLGIILLGTISLTMSFTMFINPSSIGTPSPFSRTQKHERLMNSTPTNDYTTSQLLIFPVVSIPFLQMSHNFHPSPPFPESAQRWRFASFDSNTVLHIQPSWRWFKKRWFGAKVSLRSRVNGGGRYTHTHTLVSIGLKLKLNVHGVRVSA